MELNEGQLDMVERAARNSVPTGAREEMILAVLLELIEQERKRRGLADFGDRVQADRDQLRADAGPNDTRLEKWLGPLGDIRRQVLYLRCRLARMRAEMEWLEAEGMYPAVPSFTWEARENDGYEDKRYLRLIFPSRTPGIARKVYVGCKAERIAEARRLTGNRRGWEWLEREATRLDRFLRMQKAGLERVASQVARYEIKELSTDSGSGLNGLGTGAAPAPPAGVTNLVTEGAPRGRPTVTKGERAVCPDCGADIPADGCCWYCERLAEMKEGE